MKAIGVLCFFLAISLGLSAPDEDSFSVVSTDVTFRLFTRQSPTEYTLLQTGNLNGAKLDSTKPFKFIIHGWLHNAGLPWVMDMKSAFLIKGDYNVIAVDWSGVASQLYNFAADDTQGVGKYVALLITDLHNTLGVPYSNVHVVGHSMGAHVSGFCGKYLLATVDTSVARISGLDPAGPLFVGQPPSLRLNPGDANYTDVIHTDGNAIGYYGACGDIDFYPNGGTPLQPGCITRTGNAKDDALIGCSHLRATAYFTESINSNGFISTACNSYVAYLLGFCKGNKQAVMGENVDQSSTGVLYLTTNAWSPYARNGAI